MSEKKEVEGGSKVEDTKELVDDKKSKGKKETTKKANHNNSVEEENDESSKETSSPENKKTKATKSKKASKKSDKAENQNEEGEEELDDIEVKKKIPLLDQPPIIEGSRVRTTVLKFEQKPLEKLSVSLPGGKGKPLGKIPVVNQRLKRLRIVTVKHLHRFIFGRIGKVSLILSNIQKFNGFPFLEDSDDYNRKVTALNKLPMDELKELVFSFDLDMKLKKKDECAKEILNFLISPKTSEKTQNPSLSHPKRKATKRNYYDADVDEEDTKKRKKPKASADSKKEKSSENGETSKATAKSSKTNDKSPTDDVSKKNDDQDSSNELKKPAKKRKRNQIIEEEENKKSKSQDEKSENEKNDAEGEDEDSEGGSPTSDSQSPARKSGSSKDKLSDEELKIFLKKVLADLNLENTTMKTVYNLISSEYPTYDFSKKKRFIKGVVKSLIQ